MAAKKKQAADLDALIGDVNKRFGPGTVMLASESVAANIARVPTGIPSVDYISGGGIPVGRFIGISGNEMAAKSALCHVTTQAFLDRCRDCLRTLEECQEDSGDCPAKPMKVLWLDVEGTYDASWAEKLGVDNSRIILIRPDSTEKGVDIMEAMVRTGEIDLIVVDSVSALAPNAELEASAFDSQMGVNARALNKAWRVLGAANNARGQMSHGVTILLVNQVREKLSGYGGKTTPGGLGQKFAWSLHLELRTEAWAIREDKAAGTKDRIGQWVVCSAVKNKTASPHGLGRFLLMVADDEETGLRIGQIDHFAQLLDYGKLFGLVEQAGAWYKIPEEVAGQELKAQGELGFRVALMENAEVLDALDRAVREKMAARHGGNGKIPLSLPSKR